VGGNGTAGLGVESRPKIRRVELKKYQGFISLGLLIAAWVLLYRAGYWLERGYYHWGYYMLGGGAYLLIDILTVVDRWNKTHDIVYVGLTAIFLIFALLHWVWLFLQGLMAVGWMIAPVVGIHVLDILQEAGV
jgi:hypothetical protein